MKEHSQEEEEKKNLQSELPLSNTSFVAKVCSETSRTGAMLRFLLAAWKAIKGERFGPLYISSLVSVMEY